MSSKLRDIQYLHAITNKHGKAYLDHKFSDRNNDAISSFNFITEFNHIRNNRQLLPFVETHSPLFPNYYNADDDDAHASLDHSTFSQYYHNGAARARTAKYEARDRDAVKPRGVSKFENSRILEIKYFIKRYIESPSPSQFITDEWEFNSDHGERYGFVKLATLLGSMLNCAEIHERTSARFGYDRRELRTLLENIQRHNVKLWYEKWGELDLHGMSRRLAAATIEHYVVTPEEEWAQMRIVFGQGKRPSTTKHQSYGTLNVLVKHIFSVLAPCQDEYDWDVCSCDGNEYNYNPQCFLCKKKKMAFDRRITDSCHHHVQKIQNHLFSVPVPATTEAQHAGYSHVQVLPYKEKKFDLQYYWNGTALLLTRLSGGNARKAFH